MITSLKISDGTTTADLTDNVNYNLAENGLDLGIAKLRTSELGGRGPIDEAEGSITIDVLSTPADVATTLANVERLQQLAIQCQRWNRGANVAGVYIEIQINAGTAKRCMLTYLNIQPPNQFADLLMVQEVEQVKISFTRRGAWLPATAETATTAGAAIPAVQSVFMTSDATIPSPLRFRYTGFVNTGLPSGQFPGGVIILAPCKIVGGASVSNSITLYEAENISGLTSTVDSNQASGGRVGRLTTASTTPLTLSMNMAAYLDTAVTRVTVYAVLKKSSASVTWQLQAQIRQYLGTPLADTSVFVDGSNVNPRVVRIGSIPNSVNANRVEVVITNLTGTSDTLDVDYFVIIEHVEEYVYEIQIQPTYIAGVTSTAPFYLEIHSQPFGRVPTSRIYNSAAQPNIIPVPYSGDIALTGIYGASFGWNSIAMLPNGTNYRVPFTLTMDVARYTAKLTPQ